MAEFCQNHGPLIATSGPAGDRDYLSCMSQREDVGQTRIQKETGQSIKVCGKIPFNAKSCRDFCPLGQSVVEQSSPQTT